MALISIWVYRSPHALTSFKVLLQDSTNQLCDCVILEVICEDTFLSDVSNSPLFSLSNQYLFSLSPNYQREYEPFWGRIRKFNMPDLPLANKSAKQIHVALPEKSIWSSTFNQLDHHFFLCSWSPLGTGRAWELVKWKTRDKKMYWK